jgi:hypothetical protein
MPVAGRHAMGAQSLAEALAMPCPACGRMDVPALPDSTLTVAWYTCPCGHFWSARVRDRRPVVAALDAPLRIPGRPESL